MEIRNEDFPTTLQAFELVGDKEIFIAEQVVSNQPEIDTFINRYIGKVIKAKKTLPLNSHGDIALVKRKNNTGVIMVIIIILLFILILYGFSTGWIQEKLNWNI